MHIKKVCLSCFIIFFLILSGLNITVKSEENPPPVWNEEWGYHQEIILPISTADANAKYQPVDIHIDFSNPCWAKNEKEHSIRVVCWDGSNWHELESQIYDLTFEGQQYISSCGIVFLIPEFANGKERYFIYYDSAEKYSPNYVDHVSVKDAYYYYEPISGIAFEGDYYEITQDGYCIYGIGQKGKAINRELSQAVMKMKPGSKNFDVSNLDILQSFCFAYNVGENDEDQVASDQSLVSKQIITDGNLMVEFGIVSESNGKELRTSNIYKYYYCPNKINRILVSVKHQVFKEGQVAGQVNVDGTYGTLVSIRGWSSTIQRMRFGTILPFLHLYGDNNQIKEYNINTKPETKNREWIVPYTDDCDLGKEAWISYDEGESGKAFGIILSSNVGIVKYGENETDGAQVKCAEKKYLDVLGTEIDYVGIIFGRNSYEKGGTHDLTIPDDLLVEFDAEFFSSEKDGYHAVQNEEYYFKTLSEYRKKSEGGGEDQRIYRLTVFPKFTGRVLAFPLLSNISGISISKIWAELYLDGELVSIGDLYKPFLGDPRIKFTKLAAGNYIIKVYRQFGKLNKKIIGMSYVVIDKDKTIDIYCTWEKQIYITAMDKTGRRIKDVCLTLSKNDIVFFENITKIDEDAILKVNYNLFDPDAYVLKGVYKGFVVYNSSIPRRQKKVNINIDLYNLSITIKDKLGFIPGVNVRPTLTSSEMDEPIELTPDSVIGGTYEFKDIPPARYKLYISHGNFYDEKYIVIPNDGDSTSIDFSAIYDLSAEALDSRGNSIGKDNLHFDILRDGATILGSVKNDETVSLPPGTYTINVYSDDKFVGSKIVDLTNDINVKIITEVEPLLPKLVMWLVIIFTLEIFILILLKKISLNTFLKLLALALIVLSLFQPWWALNAHSKDITAEKNSDMFIVTKRMIETVSYDHEKYPELATLPEKFTDFLGTLTITIISGIVLIGVSFIPNLLLKRRFSLILVSASILFLIIVALAFSFGMSKITELSLGSLNGEGTISVLLPNGNDVYMTASWGLSTGFYMFIISAIILILAGIIDFLRGKHIKTAFKKKG